MRIAWVSFAPLRETAAGLSSDVASVRYRTILPAQAIRGSKVVYVGPGTNRRTLLERFAGVDAVVFGSMVDASLAQPALELAAALRSGDIKVVADYSDDQFAHPALGPVYRAMAGAADAVVASTPGLAKILRAHTPKRVSVVGDPVEGERGEPRAGVTPPPRLLWFGHPINLPALQFGLRQLKQHRINYALTVLTAPGAGAETLGHRFRAWSTEAMHDELRQCDAVVLPTNPEDLRKALKSPTRFWESLWAGRFVIANPLPAYEPLAPYGWVGEDLGEGVAWLLAHAAEASARIRAGQKWVAQHGSPKAIGAAWKAVIEQI